MSSVDWASVDANNVSLPTIVTSTDLFDGELFGDELLDIYNSTVDDGSDHNELPQLLPPADGHEDEHHLGVHDDDGLGAFRPSTSFNDLTTLLPPMDEAEVSQQPSMNPIGSSTPQDSTKGTKKRAASNVDTDDSPPSKKKAGGRGGTRVGAGTKKQTDVAAPIAVPASAPSKYRPAVAKQPVIDSSDTNDTPNPLTEEVAVTQVLLAVSSVPKSRSVMPEAASVSGSGSSVASINSESDFKTIAQAAVSSLIQNAATSKDDPVESVDSGFEGPVDTSTAHIKALTGNNWVAACSTTVAGVVPVSAANDAKANNRARRQNLTPDERARQNRDRNREHARNTRLRKKAYVDELKRTLTELVVERDTGDAEKRQSTQREIEQREVRFRVIEELLKLRGRNEPNESRWAAILEEGFSLVLPLTDFRKMVSESVEGAANFEQTLNGVSEVMADAALLSTFLQSLNADGGAVTFQYVCDRKNFFMDGCNAVMEWTATSVGATSQGSRSELSLTGTIRGKFSPASNKLLSANVSFNTGAVLVQLPQILSKENLSAEYPQDMANAAAQAAASQADAILDSLQMPCLPSSTVPSAVSVVASSSSSSSEHGSDGHSLDGSDADEKEIKIATARSTQRIAA